MSQTINQLLDQISDRMSLDEAQRGDVSQHIANCEMGSDVGLGDACDALRRALAMVPLFVRRRQNTALLFPRLFTADLQDLSPANKPTASLLNRLDVLSPRTLGALADAELDRLSFLQHVKPRFFNRRMMEKQISRLTFDESKAFVRD